ncbi:hypothetical protein G6F22_015624 [Rhizopus arrhizus]|nr:hypothetical protein G6F22_015624 [Rhizopus arrhizus]
MAGLPHGGAAPRLDDGARHVAAAFHVVDDLGARVAFQHVAREENQLPVGPDDLSRFRHHPQPVAVAVKGQAHFAVGIAQAIDQVLQVLRICRVGVVARKRTVHFAEELGHFATQRAEQRRRHRARHAAAAIDGDLHRARHADRRAIQHDLEAVVGRRVVAARDGDAGAGVHQARGEVHHRRGGHADIDDVHARRTQPRLQRGRQFHAADPAVAPDHDRARALVPRLGAYRHAQAVGKARIDLVRHRAAYVISLENRIQNLRGIPAKSSVHASFSGWRYLGPLCLKSP